MPAANGNHWLGLDIGGTKILAVVVAADGSLLGRAKVESRREEGPEAVLDRAVSVADDLRRRNGPCEGVGAGFAGLVDHRKGRVLSSIMLPGWDGFPLGARLSTALGLPALVDNDATAAGYGEYVALGAPARLNMVLLTVGTGIGGAIFLDGRLFRGATGTAAEFGNTTIDWQGETCWCGNRGCLNMLASGSAIAARASRLAGRSTTGGLAADCTTVEVVAAARGGDALARQALHEGAGALGVGVANLLNIFNPDRVVLTGGVMEAGEWFLDRVREEAKRRAMAEPFAHAVIAASTLGYEAGAIGAACLARDHVRGEESG